MAEINTSDQNEEKLSRVARLHFSNKEKVELPTDYSQKLWEDLTEGKINVNGFLTVGKTTYSLFQVTKIEWYEEPFEYSFNHFQLFPEGEENKKHKLIIEPVNKRK
ncbi:hypothetical protein M3196_00200 [Fictibacillus nanhaiensis]|uniref:hypothetical protein n=1 Tax=Fictibacillus nanhaiensis TaxID=742169 RepID=UPI00203D74A2|nr:hypothetical protein [Fictibacillus nanhaiensis]MCM3730090.1 hypothetical protein [Fictibacillus nanhaiensis]